MTAAVHPLRIANYRNYWLARLAGTVAQSAFAIILGWQVYHIARETMDIREAAFMLGMIGLAQFVPLFALTPITGLAADSIDRRYIIRGTTTLLALNTLMLGLATWEGWINLPLLFFSAVLVGVARAFGGPAFGALAPNLVPRESLPTAIALGSIAMQVGFIAGPSVGGLLFAIGPIVAYAGMGMMFMIALALLFSVKKVPQPPAQKDRRPLARIADGFAYVKRNRLVQAAITLDLFAVLLAGATALLPIYARDILHVGPTGLGLLAAGMGIGASLTGIYLSFRPMKTDVGRKMLIAVVVFGLAILTFGVSTNFVLSVAALIVAGSADMVSMYVRGSLIQLHTPDEMRGRVSAVSQLTISASNELGEAESGLMASLLGPVGAVVVGGVGAITVTLLWSRLFPELKNARTFDPPEEPLSVLAPETQHGVSQP